MTINKKAFTIVELAIAMAFVSSLILGIGMVTIRIAQIYQKGLTLKSINDTGRELVDDFAASISASNYTSSDWSNKNTNKKDDVFRVTTFNVDRIRDKVPAFGAFCTGKYSYFWNSGYLIQPEKYTSGSDDVPVQYRIDKTKSFTLDKTVSGGEKFRLLRIPDTEKKVCAAGVFPDIVPKKSEGMTLVLPENTIELITESEDNLALYDLTIFQPTYHGNTGQAYLSGTFILGTITNKQDDVNITVDKEICSGKPADNFTTDFVYCAINKFSFAARAMAKVE